MGINHVYIILLLFLSVYIVVPLLPEGVPNFEQYLSNVDNFTVSDKYIAFMNQHYYRMQVYIPYFDNRTNWYANGWAYLDSYAIYTYSNWVTQHPEWILKDLYGSNLYIPYDCKGGICPQYAGDFGNPDFRNAWLNMSASLLANGNYKGLWIDDVNFVWRVSDGNGNFQYPIDLRTGKNMTLSDWQQYLVEFLEIIRKNFPNKEIVHNALWFADPTLTNPYVIRQIKACDYYLLERGVVDKGLQPFQSGFWGLDNLIGLVGKIHDLGRPVSYHSYAANLQEAQYQLAWYFLTSNGADTFGTVFQTDPISWWPAYDIKLGNAKGNWYMVNNTGLVRRDFEGGIVISAPPGVNATINFSSKYLTVAGTLESNFKLTESSGLVLRVANI